MFIILSNIHNEIFCSKPLYNPYICRVLVHSQLWYILKSKHIQGPTENLRWSILLRTLCVTIAYLDVRYIKTFAYSEPTANLLPLLYLLLVFKSLTYSLAINFFGHFIVYELQSS